MPEPPEELSGTDQKRIAGVRRKADVAARTQAAHPPAAAVTTGARAAVAEPPAETEAQAQGAVIATLDDRPPPSPEIEELCKRIYEVIRSKRPPDEESLVKADPAEMAREAGGSLNESVQGDTQRVQGGYDEINAPPQGQPSREPTPIEPAPSSVETPPVGAEAAVPDAVPAEDVSLEADVAANQARIDQAGMNTEAAQLVQSGPIAEARAAQGELEAVAERDPAEVVAEMEAARTQAGADMAALQQSALEALASTRSATVSDVSSRQHGMVGSEQQMRDQVGRQAEALFESAQQRVNNLLEPLPRTAMSRWDAGVEELSWRFKQRLNKVEDWIEERHSGGWGTVVSVWDRLTGLPGWVTDEYNAAEQEFGDDVCNLIRDISRDVNSVVAACEAIIAEARKQIAKLFAELPASLQEWAAAEQARFGEQLDGLQQRAIATRDNFNRDLVQRASQSVQEVREQIHELRKKAGGLVGRIVDAVNRFIEDPVKFIIDGLLELVGIPPASFWALVARIQEVISDIADDPLGFASNLLAAVGEGFNLFFNRIGEHLLKGLLHWLFSGLGKVGISIPTDLSLKSIITFFLELMGISWARIRKLLAKHIGEENIALIEKAFSIVADLVQMGPQGLFEMIKDKLNPQTILDMVLQAAVDFLTEALIKQVSARIVLLFNPVGAIAQAIEAIYRVLKWIFQNAARIFSLVETVVNGIYDILHGNISGMAKAVENALASLIAPVIDFLADYIGLGDLPDKIAETIKGFQDWIEGLLDQVIGWLVAKGKELLKAVGLGGEEKKPSEGTGEHATLASQAKAELQKVEGSQKDYDTLKAEKLTQAQQLETTFTSKLEPGVAMTIQFKEKSKDEEDSDIDFEIIIAPNTLKEDGAIQIQQAEDSPVKEGDEILVNVGGWWRGRVEALVPGAQVHASASGLWAKCKIPSGLVYKPVSTISRDFDQSNPKEVRRPNVLTDEIKELLKHPYLHPGPGYPESVPIGGVGTVPSDEQKATIQQIGDRHGGHTGGSKGAGQVWVADHQPPTALIEHGIMSGPQALFPQSRSHSNEQGVIVRKIIELYVGKK